MKQQFHDGDIVVFRASREYRPFEVSGIGPEKVLLTDLETKFEEEAYPHLLALAEPIMQFFRFLHLPEELQAVSAPFAALAGDLVQDLPRNPERTVALRKLLEAKDAAVRAALYQQ